MNSDNFKTLFTNIFIGFCLAALFGGEIAFQLNSTREQKGEKLYDAERAELDSVLYRPDVIEAKESIEWRILPIQEQMARTRYSKFVIELNRQIDEAWKPYKELVESYQKPIRAHYAARREQSTGTLSDFAGLQFGVIPSLAAVFLAYLSTKWLAGWPLRLLLTSAIAAQIMASWQVYHGAILWFGDWYRAVGIAIMFFAVVPVAYHFGVRTFRSKKAVEEKSKPSDGAQRFKPLSVDKSNGHHERIFAGEWAELWAIFNAIESPSINDGKNFVRLLVMTKKIQKGNLQNVAIAIGITDWRTGLRRAYQNAKTDLKPMSFEKLRSEINQLIADLKHSGKPSNGKVPEIASSLPL